MGVANKAYATIHYTSTISSASNQAVAANVCMGATKVPIYGFSLAITHNGAGTDPLPTITGINFTSTNSAADVTKYQLWWSSSNVFSGAIQLGSDITTSLGTGSHTFSFSTQTLNDATTYYFWVTTDISSTAMALHTINVSAIANSGANITYGVLPWSSNGASTAGGTKTISVTPTITGTAPGARCGSGTVTLEVTASGGTIRWYSAPTGGILMATGASYTTGSISSNATYYVDATSGSCTSAPRIPVTATVNSLPTISAGAGTAICNGSSATLTASGGTTYRWSPATGLSATTGATVTANPTSNITYTVTGTSAAGCNNTASISVTVNALPTITVSAGVNPICNGSSTTLTASGGAAYTWLPAKGLSATTGASVTATPSSTTVYTITGTTGGCSNTASITVTVNNLPIIRAGSGAAICNGSSTTLTATGGTTYVWMPGTGLSATTGASVTATPSTTTVYTVTGTSGNCSGNSTVTVSLNPLPTVFGVTGGGAYCSGLPGVHIGLSSSTTGVMYTLYRGDTTFIITVAGTGGALDFGLRTAANTFHATAINSATGCTNNMSGSAVVSIIPLPTAYTITGGGSYCAGGTGVYVGLNGSDIGTVYQLYNGTLTVGTQWAGTGNPIDFGIQTAAGTYYYVVATNTTTGCISIMTGNVAVAINPWPFVFAVTGGGSYCAGGTGVVVGLYTSVGSTNYQLYLNGLPNGSPVPGTGTSISFGLKTDTGSYTVGAINMVTGCVNNMSGSATVAIESLPTAFTVTGGGIYCSGGVGLSIGLSSSTTGVVYQLYRGTTATDNVIFGTGAGIDYGLQTVAGTYTVVATRSGSLCTNRMAGSVVIAINPLPDPYMVSGGGSYTTGDTGVHIKLSGSTIGINYQLYRYSILAGTPLAGNGGALDFGLQTLAGTYMVVAANVATACIKTMTGSVSVLEFPRPSVYRLSGGGHYCLADTGVLIRLEGSYTGVNYQLMRDNLQIGSLVKGTGHPLDFRQHAVAGRYSAVASNEITGSTSNMTGFADVIVDTFYKPIIVITGNTGVNIMVGQYDTLRAIALNWDSTFTYQWVVNSTYIAGATSASYISNTFENLDTVACCATSYSPCGSFTSVSQVVISVQSLGANQIVSSKNTMILVPNPNNGKFQLKGMLGSNVDADVLVTIINAIGQIVYKNYIKAYRGEIDQMIELGDTIPSGRYILNLNSGIESEYFRVVIQK